jgi:hypothetical protein
MAVIPGRLKDEVIVLGNHNDGGSHSSPLSSHLPASARYTH